MVEVKLRCGVYGEGSVFSVKIERSADVEALREVVAGVVSTEQHAVPPRLVTLYLARKDDMWLRDDDTLDEVLGGDIDKHYKKMRSSWKLNKKELFGSSFTPGDEEIHVLVELAPAAVVAPMQQRGLWLVRGSCANALSTKGIRCRLYRLAGTNLGYYDPARRTGDKDSAFWYEEKTLRIHVLFKKEENALRFDNTLQDETVTLGSPLNGHAIVTSVEHVTAVPPQLRRIYFVHYEPQESESPQDTISSISLSSCSTLLDPSTDEFRYQRIEHERYFLPYGKAESCHLVSKKQSRDHKREFAKYDRDRNNRLALSREMHGYYDGLSYEVPIVNMFPGSVEQKQSISNRYKVEVFVKVLDERCKDRVFSRLKDGTAQTDDPLVMKTFVHVEDPETFCFCMRWKYDYNDECWRDFLSMTPAAD